MAEFNEMRRIHILRQAMVVALLCFGAFNVVVAAMTLATL